MTSKEMTVPAAEGQRELPAVTRDDMKKVWRRSYHYYLSWGLERQANTGFLYCILPVLKKLYGEGTEDLKEAMKRHLDMFACHIAFCTFIMGIVCSMEEKNAREKDFDPELIRNVKVALMGPLSGIGDSFFYGPIRTIAIGIGTTMMLAGNPLGILVYIAIYFAPIMVVKWNGLWLGWKAGAGFLDKMQRTGLMDKAVHGAGIMGMMAIGCMTCTMAKTNLSVMIGSGETAKTLQSIMDGIMPNCVILGVVWLLFYLVKKKNISPLLLVFIVLAACILLAFIGIV